MNEDLEFSSLVEAHYPGLYRFALSLTRDEAEAGDLTQDTFYVWATKGHQLRDRGKIKSWLYTTLHRQFLEKARRQARFFHVDIGDVEEELPSIDPEGINALDGETVLKLLAAVDEQYQAAVALFYLEDYSYKEIAEITHVPLGTVKSRISRGIAQLQSLLAKKMAGPNLKPTCE